MTVEFLFLRLIHVVGGAFWIGSALFTAFFLMPALKGAGPAVVGQVFAQMAKRRVMTVMPIVAVVTVLSGLRLMMIVSENFSGAYFATSSGRAFATSGALALLAFLLGMLARGLDPKKKLVVIVSNTAILLLLLGAGGMALARYL